MSVSKKIHIGLIPRLKWSTKRDHSLWIRGLHFTKCSSEILQKKFFNVFIRKNHVVFFVFHLMLLYIFTYLTNTRAYLWSSKISKEWSTYLVCECPLNISHFNELVTLEKISTFWTFCFPSLKFFSQQPKLFVKFCKKKYNA